MPKFLSPAQFSAELGISRASFERMLRRGEVNTLLVGSRRLVLASDLDRFASIASTNIETRLPVVTSVGMGA